MEAYKQRMITEYRELKERADKLATMMDKWDKGTLDFTPTCPMYLLENQLETMKDYVGILQTRAKLEDVDLNASVDDAPVEKAGWIPVTERLPEDIRPVIVTWKNTDPKSYYQYIVGKHFTGTACYKNGKWYWYSSTTEDMLAEYGRYDSEEFDEAIECIAWMPLPEPYREERTEE